MNRSEPADPGSRTVTRDRAMSVLALVTSRSRRFLRTSALLLALVVTLSASVMIYLEYGYVQQQDDFTNNSNLRLISVTHREGPAGSVDSLNATDSETVLDLAVAAVGEGEQPIVSTRYELGVGISTSDGRAFTVYGVDPGLAPVLGLKTIGDGVGYVTEGAVGPSLLEVPVISESEGGYDSSAAVELKVTLASGLDTGKIEFLRGGNPSPVMYVSTTTFEQIAAAMFDAPWTTVQRRWAAGELSMTPLIGGIYVYTSSIDQVRPVAEALRQDGYGTAYGLLAFNGIEKTLRETTALAAVVAVLLLSAASTYLMLSWRSYLRLSRRDIAIMKHWGIGPELIRATYARQLSRICWIAWACAVTVSAIVTPLVIGGQRSLIAAAANVIVLGGLLLLLRLVLVRTVIRPQLSTDVLVLLRREREFQ